MQELFWCGTVMLLSKVMQQVPDHAIDIHLEGESVTGNTYIYHVLVGDTRYDYHFSMDSNTRVVGEFYINHNGEKSPVYIIEKQHGYYHIAASSYQFDDVILIAHDKMIVVTIDNGKKSVVMTLSIEGKGLRFKVLVTQLPVHESDDFSPRIIRDMFMISGAVDQMRTTLLDPIGYETSKSAMLSYSDEGRTIVGVEYVSNAVHLHTDTLQGINTEYNQMFNFKLEHGLWMIQEYTDGFNDRITKRSYSFQLKDHTIMINKNMFFDYQVTDGHLIFKRY